MAMRKELLQIGLGVAWLLGVPLAAPLLRWLIHDHWILQTGSQQYLWGGLLAASWYGGLWLFWPAMGELHSAKLLPLPLLFAGILVWNGGYVLLALANSVGDDSPSELVDVRLVQHQKNAVRFATTSGSAAGLEFECSVSNWGPVGVGERRLVLRRGRLGVFWGRLQRPAR